MTLQAAIAVNYARKGLGTKQGPWVRFHNAADKARPQMQRVVKKAIQDFKDSVPEKTLEFYLRMGDLQSALSLFQFTNKFEVPLQEPFQSIIEPLAIATAEFAAEDLARELEARESKQFADFLTRLRLTKNAAREWASTFAAEEIYRISERMRRGVRREVERSFLYMRNGQINITTLSRRIKDLGIGLTDRLQLAVHRREQLLLDSGLPRVVVDRLIKRYYTQLLNYRTEMIARTETMTAANMGQQMVWWQAVDNGLISSASRRVWITTNDERTCPICERLDGAVVGLNQDFKVNVSNVAYTALVPPIHPWCRCYLVLQLP